MRTLLVTAALLLTANFSFGQSEPFKGATTIMITCSDSGDDLYKRVGQHLISKGAIIDKSSPEFLTITTAPIETSRYNLLFYVTATIIKEKVRVNTFYKINVDNLAGVGASSFDKWEYRAGKDNAMNVVYLDIMKLIDGFPNTSIEYQK